MCDGDHLLNGQPGPTKWGKKHLSNEMICILTMVNPGTGGQMYGKIADDGRTVLCKKNSKRWFCMCKPEKDFIVQIAYGEEARWYSTTRNQKTMANKISGKINGYRFKSINYRLPNYYLTVTWTL
jgi:hypothetical protein